MSAVIDFVPYTDMGLDDEQMAVVCDALEKGLSADQIKYITNPKYHPDQMKEICEGFEYGLTEKQVALFAKSCFSREQMYSIRTGFVNGLSVEDVSSFAHPEYSWEQMDRMRERLERGEKIMNTKIDYLYRDGANYKSWNECVIQGVLSDQQKATIIDCLDCGEYFVPSKVGLPERRFDKWDDEFDHIWFELNADGFSETSEPANVPVTADQLVQAFCQCKGNWERDFCSLDGLIREAFLVEAKQRAEKDKDKSEKILGNVMDSLRKKQEER